MWVVKRNVLLHGFLGWIAAFQNWDGTYDDKLWMARSSGQFSLTGKRYGSLCGHCYFETFACDRCSGFFMIAVAEEKASPFACPVFPFMFSKLPRRSVHWQKKIQKELVIISAFFMLVLHGHLLHAGAGWEESFRFRYHAYFIPSHESLGDTIILLTERLFLFGLLLPVQPMMVMFLKLRVTFL